MWGNVGPLFVLELTGSTVTWLKGYTGSDYASWSVSCFILLQNIHLEEGGVGGEQRVVRAELVPLLEQPLLERQHLRDGLHHDIRAPEAGLGLRHVADVVRAPRHELLPRRGVILEPGLNMMRKVQRKWALIEKNVLLIFYPKSFPRKVSLPALNPFFATLLRLSTILFSDLASTSALRSTRVTLCWVWAAIWKYEMDQVYLCLEMSRLTWAIPVPIRPPPITTTWGRAGAEDNFLTRMLPNMLTLLLLPNMLTGGHSVHACTVHCTL